MIRLVRPPEPEALRRKRPGKIAAARALHVAGAKLEITGYSDDGVKEALFQGQRRKCAYCEKPEEQSKHRPAEHYRPKARYWWLAWTWENLLFACPDCNSGHKGEYFPLVDAAQRLVAEDPPPGGEQPLLIDPYDPGVDPGNEIEFRREEVQGLERWKPYGLTERGRETIRICGLDRPSLLTNYKIHVRKVVLPKVERLLEVVETGIHHEIAKAWRILVWGLLGEYQPFQALSRDAIRVLVSEAVRSRYQLTL